MLMIFWWYSVATYSDAILMLIWFWTFFLFQLKFILFSIILKEQLNILLTSRSTQTLSSCIPRLGNSLSNFLRSPRVPKLRNCKKCRYLKISYFAKFEFLTSGTISKKSILGSTSLKRDYHSNNSSLNYGKSVDIWKSFAKFSDKCTM